MYLAPNENKIIIRKIYGNGIAIKIWTIEKGEEFDCG